MTFHRVLAVLSSASLALFISGCAGDTSPTSQEKPASSASARPAGAAPQPSDPVAAQFCAQNLGPSFCKPGSYIGPFVSLSAGGGHWDATGTPVNGGPVGADGSTGSNLTQEYCARNQDPACPLASYVAPNAVKNPDGSHTYVTCEGTICTNPNHGGGDPPGHWSPDGQPFDGGPMGADGSTGNNLTHEYCARNQDPACPLATYVAPNAIANPDGTNSYVVCEGTICTNPNFGGSSPEAATGDNPDGPPDLDNAPDPGSDDTPGPDDTSGIDDGSGNDDDPGGDDIPGIDGSGTDGGPGTDDSSGTDDSAGTDDGAGTDDSAGLDDGSGMDDSPGSADGS